LLNRTDWIRKDQKDIRDLTGSTGHISGRINTVGKTDGIRLDQQDRRDKREPSAQTGLYMKDHEDINY
jgi:hypothetical protein